MDFNQIWPEASRQKFFKNCSKHDNRSVVPSYEYKANFLKIFSCIDFKQIWHEALCHLALEKMFKTLESTVSKTQGLQAKPLYNSPQKPLDRF